MKTCQATIIFIELTSSRLVCKTYVNFGGKLTLLFYLLILQLILLIPCARIDCNRTSTTIVRL